MPDYTLPASIVQDVARSILRDYHQPMAGHEARPPLVDRDSVEAAVRLYCEHYSERELGQVVDEIGRVIGVVG